MKSSSAKSRGLRAALLLGVLVGTGCTKQPVDIPPSQPAPPPEPAASDEAWRKERPTPGPREPFDYPIPTSARLDNGLSLYVVPRNTAVVAASLVQKTGSNSDPSNKGGLAALAGRMLTEGTLDKNDRELAQASEQLGSELSVDVSYDATELDFEFLSGDLGPALALMAEVFTRPRFDAKVFDRVKSEWLDQLRDERQDPTSLAAIVGMRVTLGPGWGAPTQGSLSGVQALQVQDLKAHHLTHFRPDQAALVVAGGVTLAQVQSAAQRAFASWRSPRHAPSRNTPERGISAAAAATGTDARLARVLLVDRPDSVQSALFVATPFPARAKPGYEARELLNQVLGGMFTSRINQNLREAHGYTYGARSHNLATEHFGVWYVATSVRSDATVPALDEILKELEAVQRQRPVTDAELDRGRQELLGTYSAHLERSNAVASDAVEIFAHGLGPGYFAHLDTVLGQLTASTVTHEVRTHLDPKRLTAVVVGDRRALAKPLEALLGRVEEAPSALMD